MQSTIKIGIVEDELIIAEKIRNILIGMGYETCEPASNYDESFEMIITEKPDLLLLDINLGNRKDGIDIAEKINELYQIPFIFLTANSDSVTIDRAKKVKPNAYLVKPFKKEELYAAIEIVFSNHSSKIVQENIKPVIKDFVFLKENHRFIKLQFSEIIYVESCENYVVVHTRDKKNSIIRSTFSDFLTQLPSNDFIRTHRGFAVQVKFIENIEPTELIASGHKIPVSNTYKAELYSTLGIGN